MDTSTAAQTVTIDGQHYKREDLSQSALAQLDNLQFVDREMTELNNRLAVLRTARRAYAKVLESHLPAKKAPANKKKDVVSIDGSKYNRADFSDEGLAQLANLQFTDSEIEQTNNRYAVFRTARTTYAQTLGSELNGVQPATAH
ncbi:DUF6447 family protein [Vreelandella utahensis]|uniref:DUF6447 family protein n=1 Tax=Vreelandella halophila TaxID=86177 RepID=UPI0015C372F8|nr:DUF6447 family protein [Halomonas utahensis]